VIPFLNLEIWKQKNRFENSQIGGVFMLLAYAFGLF